MKNFDMNMSIGDSVTLYPVLSGVYMQYGIDFCCGGERTVATALDDTKEKQEVVLKAIEETLIALEASGESTRKLSEMTNQELIDNIVHNHHGYLRRILPELGIKLFKLIEVHGQSHPELFEVHHLVGMLRIELEAHLVKEEQQLFPLILDGDTTKVEKLIYELEKEHDAAGDILKRLTVITDHFKVPKDGCATYSVTYGDLQQLQADMYQHAHKENNVLFQRF